MTTRTDVIAGVLRRPVLQRPVLGHELRERLVQGLGPGSTVAEWTATVPQLAGAIDSALVQAAAALLGTVLGRIRPGTRLDALAVPWDRHTGAQLPATA